MEIDDEQKYKFYSSFTFWNNQKIKSKEMWLIKND